MGTSSVRCLAIDQQLQILAQSRVALPLPQSPARGHAEQSPAIWHSAFLEALTAICHQINPQQIKAFCVDATSASVYLSDTNAEPASTALMYNDARAISILDSIRNKVPAGHLTLSASSSLAKALFLRLQLPADARYAITHQADLLNQILTGKNQVTDKNNALKLGYDNIADKWPDWLTALADEYHLQLPQVVSTGTLLAGIDKNLARQFDINPQALVCAGTTDSTASSLASGIIKPGDAVTTIGTTMTIKVIASKSIESIESGIYSHILPDGLWLAGGASNVGGRVLQDFFSPQQIIELSEQIDPRSFSGLDYYPLSTIGERFPINDPEKHPVLTPRPDDDITFLQAIFEGLARVEKMAYQKLAGLGACYPEKIITAGGAASTNQALLKIRQNILGVPVVTARQTEAAFGVALIAKNAWQKSMTG